MKNIFANLPVDPQRDELFECILTTGQFRLKKIVSTGQSTPADEWYDQDDNEWCILLKGQAGLRFENEPEVVVLNPGDHIHIPAHRRHQVAWTQQGEPTVWLALYYASLQRAQEWSIEARAFLIPCTPFTHNFWALVDPEGGVVDQLHGLAVDPATGEMQAVGNSSHLLQAVNDSTILWSLQPDQPRVTCISGPESEIRRRWQSAVNAVPAINALELSYPAIWQQIYKENSNSVFNTLGQIMGFSQPANLLQTQAPGIELIISQSIVDDYCYKS